jgi:hypothetical protein
MLEIDRYALGRAAAVPGRGAGHYEVYEFHPVVAKLQLFCSEDLGGFYLDVLKDRLYTTAPKSLARRSAQTALWQITHAMLRWMAPFLSFTAEEAWKVFGKSESIFLETFATLPAPDAALLAKWARIREIREWSTRTSKPCAPPARWARRCRPRHADGAPRRPRAAGQPGRRPEVRVHHLRYRRWSWPSAAAVSVTASSKCQMRALLALPRRRGPRRRPPHPLRPLHQQPVRRGETRKVA